VYAQDPSMMNFARPFVSLVFAIVACPLAAECLGKTPLDAARVLRDRHSTFYADDPALLADVVSRRLLAVIRPEYECISRGQVCAIDFDPWVGHQYGDMGPPVTYSATSVAPRHAVVLVRYTFEDPPGSLRRRQTTRLFLERTSAAGCWRVSDLVGPAGDSVQDRLSKAYPRSGMRSDRIDQAAPAAAGR
jgi:hypothetical protein